MVDNVNGIIEEIRLALLHPKLLRCDLVNELDKLKIADMMAERDGYREALKLIIAELEYDITNGGIALNTARCNLR